MIGVIVNWNRPIGNMADDVLGYALSKGGGMVTLYGDSKFKAFHDVFDLEKWERNNDVQLVQVLDTGSGLFIEYRGKGFTSGEPMAAPRVH